MTNLSEHYLNRCLGIMLAVPFGYTFLMDKKGNPEFESALKELDRRGEFSKHNFAVEWSRGDWHITKTEKK